MNTTHCPRCGQRNQCAQAESATPVSDCWCFSAGIDPAVLDSLPPEQRNRACLCPRCAQGLLPSTTPPAAD
ncbi:cysteine-rich CWC family protein [Pseudomonas paeninsulae]|uniref:cysteine-rich CWC family protein n=1 Tax=Pseudomonas paeninsulae TaxID=3110772 RepID=UPI002D77165B|nr:cysteine-rich CWC family protein [Pseudomonas sp. IT1137]